MHPRVRKEVLIKGSKLILQGQGGPKMRWVDFTRSLTEAIVPSGGTQHSARLRRDGVLPCKVVITSTHALPRIPGGSYGESSPNGWRISQLWSLIDDLRCAVSGVGASENPMKLKEDTLATQISWNLALGYTSLQSSDSNRHQYVNHLQNAPNIDIAHR